MTFQGLDGMLGKLVPSFVYFLEVTSDTLEKVVHIYTISSEEISNIVVPNETFFASYNSLKSYQ